MNPQCSIVSDKAVLGREVRIGRAKSQLLEEDRIELAIMVLAGMDEEMVKGGVERRDHSG